MIVKADILFAVRFPPRHGTNGKGKAGRGIGSHTDYGLLVIAAQDEVGGKTFSSPKLVDDHANLISHRSVRSSTSAGRKVCQLEEERSWDEGE